MSQTHDSIPSPTTGLMNKPATGTDLLKPSAAQDDEEHVDYDDFPTGDAADGDRGNEDADVGNMSGGGEGSPSPETTAADASEPEPAQVSAPLEEQHLPGSSTTTASPAALPETTAATPPLEQQLVQVSAPMQEQALPASSTVAASSTAVMKISLAPTEAGPSESPARAMMALTSSPSQLNVSVASATSTPKSLVNPYFGASTSGVVESSSIAFSSPTDAPDFLHMSLSYLNSLVRKVIEVVTAGRMGRGAELSCEEAVVNTLGAKNADTLLNYRKEAQALERAKKEAAAEVAPSEDELRRKAEAVVRANHEEKLSDAKAQLASFDLNLCYSFA
ncbi:brain acid soluble protein 1-like [Asparagus officinalis]|uniref:brain acid soluble protein 1-like n=1 Tax=Asparagus officinalis TaxID=4686 RepID=UPI00098E1301|nr:brain acid soluble protein 1-like [Asparagus officinalis]